MTDKTIQLINLPIYKKFLHFLKENHILYDYLNCLNKYNLHHPANIKNFSEWLYFANKNIKDIISKKDMIILLSDIRYFCDWWLGNIYLSRKYNKQKDYNWFNLTYDIKLHLTKLFNI